jgi:hypothetical protein
MLRQRWWMVTTTPGSGVATGDMCDGATDVSAKAAKLRFADDPTVKRIPLHAATQLLVATHTPRHLVRKHRAPYKLPAGDGVNFSTLHPLSPRRDGTRLPQISPTRLHKFRTYTILPPRLVYHQHGGRLHPHGQPLGV